MATAKPNILINSISGRLGNVVFYTRRRAASGAITQCVRAHVIPRNPDTVAQRAVRLGFRDAVRSWQSMSADEKYTYARKARYLNMSGYNLYISKYMKRVIQSLNLASTDKQNSKIPSLPRNLELATWNSLPLPERFPSVSASYIKASGVNKGACPIKPRPG